MHAHLQGEIAKSGQDSVLIRAVPGPSRILFTYLALSSYVGGGESHSSSGSKVD